MTESDDPQVIPLNPGNRDGGFFQIKSMEIGKCLHRSGFVVDIREREVECACCEKTMDPMEVLIKLAGEEAGQRHDAENRDEVEKRFYHRQIKRLLARRNMPPFRVEQTRQWLRDIHKYTSVELARKARELEGVLRQLNSARREAQR